MTTIPALTGQHVELLRLAANGATNADMAARTDLTVHTVNDHLKHAYRALGARSRAHAVAICMARGLVRPEDIARIPAAERVAAAVGEVAARWVGHTTLTTRDAVGRFLLRLLAERGWSLPAPAPGPPGHPELTEIPAGEEIAR